MRLQFIVYNRESLYKVQKVIYDYNVHVDGKYNPQFVFIFAIKYDLYTQVIFYTKRRCQLSSHILH
jgi:hypothetical protein